LKPQRILLLSLLVSLLLLVLLRNALPRKIGRQRR
jgi:hypothetical protein